QTAEGNLRAARDAVRLFGKTDEEVDRIIADRKADPTLVVPCPIDGRATAQRGAGIIRAAGSCARAIYGSEYRYDVDVGERRRKRQSVVPGRAVGAGQYRRFSWPRVRRQDHDRGRQR